MGAGDVRQARTASGRNRSCRDSPMQSRRGRGIHRDRAVDRATGLPARPHGHGPHWRRGRVFRQGWKHAQLRELLVWKTIDAEVAVVRVRLEPADRRRGSEGLGGEARPQARLVKHEGERIVCGGGARLPSVAARAAQAGPTGIEFGVNIPGTVGGAVRMNANAYGGSSRGARVGGGN